MHIGWKRLFPPEDFDLPKFKAGVLSGEAAIPVLLPGGLIEGNMRLMSEGEGEGAREEKALDAIEDGLMSQFCSSSRSSPLDGPPSEMSANIRKILNL